MGKITRFKVKIQEEGGIQLARLFSIDLARGEPCGREDCNPCKASKKRPNCKQASILYESKCEKEQEGGEEDRDLYRRVKQIIVRAQQRTSN